MTWPFGIAQRPAAVTRPHLCEGKVRGSYFRHWATPCSIRAAYLRTLSFESGQHKIVPVLQICDLAISASAEKEEGILSGPIVVLLNALFGEPAQDGANEQSKDICSRIAGEASEVYIGFTDDDNLTPDSNLEDLIHLCA